MTEVVGYEATTELTSGPDSALILWARDAAEAYKVAKSLVTTSFVPTSMQNKPHEAAAAILTGSEIGLSPMAALRSIDIIQGTPAMRAHALRGLVQSRGHEVWVQESTSTRAVVCGHRKGSEKVQESVWTLDRAKALKLTAKPNWLSQPQAMLIARATSELCRLIASDVLLGLPYSIEELSDEHTPEPVAVAPAVKRTAKRAQAPEIEAPSLDEPATSPASVPVESGEEPPLNDWPTVAVPGDAE